MRAVTLVGPKQLEITEIEKPEPDGENVIIQVSACGICGSDFHYWEIGVGMDGKPGLIMGHEFCGRIDDPGGRKELSVGERVTALPLNPCGNCESCRSGLLNICMEGMKRPNPGNNSPGAYAEYIRVRPDMVRKLPDSVSDKEAALIEPAAVSLHAVRQARVGLGDRVLVTGGGPIGLLCATWAQLGGASYVALTEVDSFRTAFAMEMGGADEAFDAADPDLQRKLKKASCGGFDVAIETSASDAGIHTAMSALRPRGRMVLTGINFSSQSIPTLLHTVKELEQKGSFAYFPEEFDWTIGYLAEKRLRIEKMVTRAIGFEEIQQVFEQIDAKDVDDIKIIVQP